MPARRSAAPSWTLATPSQSAPPSRAAAAARGAPWPYPSAFTTASSLAPGRRRALSLPTLARIRPRSTSAHSGRSPKRTGVPSGFTALATPFRWSVTSSLTAAFQVVDDAGDGSGQIPGEGPPCPEKPLQHVPRSSVQPRGRPGGGERFGAAGQEGGRDPCEDVAGPSG